MKRIEVKRDYTKLVEVLFETCEIDEFVAFDNYMKKHQVTIEVDNGTDRNVQPEMRLMKGDILTVKEL